MPDFYEAHMTHSFSADGQVVKLTRTFHALGTNDPVEVHELAVFGTTISFAGLWRESISDAQNQGGGKWLIDIIYSSIDPQQAYNPTGGGGPGGGGAQPAPSAPGELTPLSQSFSFDTTGGRKRITQSIRPKYALVNGDVPKSGLVLTVTATAPAGQVVTVSGHTVAAGDAGYRIWVVGDADFAGGEYIIAAVTGSEWTLSRVAGSTGAVSGAAELIGSAPGFGGAINVNGDRVEGCEIPVPEGHISRRLSLPFITLSYYRACKNLVGKTNNAPFYGFPKNSALYLGMQGAPGQGARTDVVHHFYDAETRFDELIGTVFVPVIRGHEFVWVRYKLAAHPVSGVLLQVPAGVYVDEVLKEGNFEILGIGA